MKEFQFAPAARTQRKARIAVSGPPGSGKTLTSLFIADGLTEGEPEPRIGLIDTEHGSASLYAGRVAFQVLQLAAPFSPARYRQACDAAVRAGFKALVVDSTSHEWFSEGGVLQMVDRNKSGGGNQFAAWNGPSQEHEGLIQHLMSLPIHVLLTFRSKMAYEVQVENGRSTPKKIGLAPVTREGVEYEADIVLDIDQEHKAVVTKSRIAEFSDQVLPKPGVEVGRRLKAWLSDGAPAPTFQVATSSEEAVPAQPRPSQPPTTRTVPPAAASISAAAAPKTGYVDTASTNDRELRSEVIRMWNDHPKEAVAFIRSNNLPSGVASMTREEVMQVRDHLAGLAA